MAKEYQCTNCFSLDWARGLTVAKIWNYKNNVQWWENHGKIPSVFQEMKPGWDSLLSNAGVCKLGGLHPLTANMMVKVHVLLFLKHRPHQCTPSRIFTRVPTFLI